MFRFTVSLLCAIAVLAPAAAFANDRDYYRGQSRPNDNRYRYPDRERTIDFDHRDRALDRDNRERDRRDAERDREWRDRRNAERDREWRDRRDDRFRRDYRDYRDDRRDRYEQRRIIIIPPFSF